MAIPSKKGKKGRSPSKLQPMGNAQRVDQYYQSLSKKDFQKERIRDTFKGNLIAEVHTCQVWLWDKNSEDLIKAILLIRRDGDQVKFALTNAFNHSAKMILKVQAWRYFIERSFQEAKNTVGMKYYQVRKYRALSHFMALIMLLMLFLLKEREKLQSLHYLISFRDIKKLFQYLLPSKLDTWDGFMEMLLLNLIEKDLDYQGNLSK